MGLCNGYQASKDSISPPKIHAPLVPLHLLSHMLLWFHSSYMNTIATKASPSQIHASMKESKLPYVFQGSIPSYRMSMQLLFKCRELPKKETNINLTNINNVPIYLTIIIVLEGSYPLGLDIDSPMQGTFIIPQLKN